MIVIRAQIGFDLAYQLQIYSWFFTITSWRVLTNSFGRIELSNSMEMTIECCLGNIIGKKKVLYFEQDAQGRLVLQVYLGLNTLELSAIHR